ncbi:MAG TPA: adenylate/guanylate cyclase domain-containing protein [Candidatus Dormibacteraeota bacterium]|nr:adenylate/guanylate cyclase domain-containing protein [Candidatus Dormibacteraeota bacterium]
MVPETRYAQVRDREVAYQVVGDGPIDVLVINPSYLPIDLMWDEPSLVRFLDRLSSFSRCIWSDLWGIGASDPRPRSEARILESGVDDMVGVLDAVGCERVAVLDVAGGKNGQLFAATHPERTRALVLDGPSARMLSADDYPEGVPEGDVDRRLSRIGAGWGTGAMLQALAPSVARDERLLRWFARCERLSVTPSEAVRGFRTWYETDTRHVLPAIKVPTLVTLRPGHRTNAQSKYVAEHIEGARIVEVPGELLFFVGDTRPMLDAVEEFVTGKLPAHDIDRVLATVVFTDLVSSTEQAARLGDRRWKELLLAHDSLVRGELERYRGREIKSTGDGFLATFDGPGRAVRCAAAMRDAVRGVGVEMRVGVHTGEIELQDDDVGGIAVHIAQRVMSQAQPGEIVVSSTVRDLVAGSGITFEDRGATDLRGVPDQWRLFAAAV